MWYFRLFYSFLIGTSEIKKEVKIINKNPFLVKNGINQSFFDGNGLQIWGPLSIELDGNANMRDVLNDRVWIKVTSKCHFLWNTEQVLRIRHLHPDG